MLNMMVGIGGYVLNTLFAFAVRIVFTRCLPKQYLGLSGLISNYLSILSLAELGIGSAIVYALYKPVAEDDQQKVASYMHSYRIAYRIIGVIVAVLGLISLPFLQFIVGSDFPKDVNIILIYFIFLSSTVLGYFYNHRISLLIAYQKQYVVSGISYILSIMTSILQIIVLVSTKNYIAYLIVFLLSSVMNAIVIIAITNKEYPFIKNKHIERINKEEKRALYKNIKRITVYKLSGVLVNHTDNLVLTYFAGLTITGLASNYTLLTNTLSSLIRQLFGSITASVGNMNALENTDRQYELFKALNLANFWFYGWASIGVAFVSTDLVALLFGPDYTLEFKISIMLAINLYMVGMQNTVWTFKNTKGLFKYGQYILFATAALNIIGDIVLGKMLGVFGIYLATAVARLFTNTWYEPYAVFRIAFDKNPRIYFRRYILFVLILTGTGSICGLLCSIIHYSYAINVLMKVIICSLVPNCIFYMLFRKKADFSYLKSRILNGLTLMRNKKTT